MQNVVKKAVFPVAGYGTRFLPFTKALPKEMLPIIDKPLIQFAVEEALAAGCTELIFVTSHAKKAIEDHFNRNIPLEHHLLQRQEFGLVQMINGIIPPNVTSRYIRQGQQLGLGHAVSCAANLIQDEPFAVVLADDLIRSKVACLRQLLTKYKEINSSVIAVEEVKEMDLSSYGVVDFYPKNQDGGFIKQIIEKPEIGMAPSNYGVVGRYILTPSIFKYLNELALVPGAREIQLSDALALLLREEPIYALKFNGDRYDCGKKTGYLRAILEHSMENPEYQRVLVETLEKKNYLFLNAHNRGKEA